MRKKQRKEAKVRKKRKRRKRKKGKKSGTVKQSYLPTQTQTTTQESSKQKER